MLETSSPHEPAPPLGPIGGPAAWRGPEMRHRRDWIDTLSPADIAEIDAALASAKARGLGADDLADDPANFPLPGFAARRDAALGVLAETGVFLLSGLPAPRYAAADLALVFRGIGCHLGVAISQNYKGERLGEVIDLSDRLESGRRYQAGGEFRMHCDPADIVGLMCVRAAKRGGESHVVSALAVHDAILHERPDLLAPLYAGYRLFRPKLDRGDAPALTAAPVPIYARNAAGAMNVYCFPDPINQAVLREGIVLAAREREAFDFLDEVAHRPALRLEMDLAPGDMQFLNNRLVLHGRTDYQDHAELERRRLMLRLWLMVPGWPALDPRQRFFDDWDKLGAGIPKRV